MAGNNSRNAKLENGHNGVGGRRFIRATIVQTDSWTPRRDETGSHCRPRSSKRGSRVLFFFLSFLSPSLSLLFFFILSTFDTCACTTRVRACVRACMSACMRFVARRFHVACKCCLLSDASAHRKVITPHATTHRIVADIWPHGQLE